MPQDSQTRALKHVADWSKWMVAVNVVATVGCVAVLQDGILGIARFFLLLAIGTFALSLMIAALLLGLLPGLIQRLPLHDERGQPASVYDGRLWGGLTVRALAVTQFALFLLAAFFFLGWVVS